MREQLIDYICLAIGGGNVEYETERVTGYKLQILSNADAERLMRVAGIQAGSKNSEAL